MNDLEALEAPAQTARGVMGTLLLLGGIALLAAPAVRGIARHWRVRHPRAATESRVDDALNDTYPASDPPAGRYVDIPVNRR